MESVKPTQATVEGDEEIQWGKGVSNEEDARSAKEAKVEGNNKAAEPQIRAGEEIKEEEEVKEGPIGDVDKVSRLRQLLRKDAKNLSKDVVDDMIRYLKAEKIVSLALEIGQGKKEEEEEEEEEDWIMKDDPRMLSKRKMYRIFRRLECPSSTVKEAEFRLVYEGVRHSVVAQMVFVRWSISCDWATLDDCVSPEIKFNDGLHGWLRELCRILHYRLFAHVFTARTGLRIYEESAGEEENAEEDSDVDMDAEEEAVEEYDPARKDICQVCLGKGRHSDFRGMTCSFMMFVPRGATVGPGYYVTCGRCHVRIDCPVDECYRCGLERAQAHRNYRIRKPNLSFL